ncbi:MAG: hypothetical protein Ct9H300mP32_6890 [Verrucomicrobiota bacterium]|nr:MAG: hypothetical protein Ct9H300mP32_6890 [Verrucomicrobiota bacterium]
MRGGFTVHVTQVRENRMLQHTHHVTVPWSNMKLDVKWERFVSKLRPGQEETWTATITGPDAEHAVAEMVATLYDASLPRLRATPLATGSSASTATTTPSAHFSFANNGTSLNSLLGSWKRGTVTIPPYLYRAFPAEITRWYSNQIRTRGARLGMNSSNAFFSAPGSPVAEADSAMESAVQVQKKASFKALEDGAGALAKVDNTPVGKPQNLIQLLCLSAKTSTRRPSFSRTSSRTRPAK